MHLHRPIPNRVSACVSLGYSGSEPRRCGGGGSSGSAAGNQMVRKRAADLPTVHWCRTSRGCRYHHHIDAACPILGVAIAPGLPSGSPTTQQCLDPLQWYGAIQTDAITGMNDVGIAIPASARACRQPTARSTTGVEVFSFHQCGQESALFIFDGEVAHRSLGEW